MIPPPTTMARARFGKLVSLIGVPVVSVLTRRKERRERGISGFRTALATNRACRRCRQYSPKVKFTAYFFTFVIRLTASPARLPPPGHASAAPPPPSTARAAVSDSVWTSIAARGPGVSPTTASVSNRLTSVFATFAIGEAVHERVPRGITRTRRNIRARNSVQDGAQCPGERRDAPGASCMRNCWRIVTLMSAQGLTQGAVTPEQRSLPDLHEPMFPYNAAENPREKVCEHVRDQISSCRTLPPVDEVLRDWRRPREEHASRSEVPCILLDARGYGSVGQDPECVAPVAAPGPRCSGTRTRAMARQVSGTD